MGAIMRGPPEEVDVVTNIEDEIVTWLAIDRRGKTHEVTAIDVMGATIELVGDSRVLHGLIDRLKDHDDPDVIRSVRWACRKIDDGSLRPMAPSPDQVTDFATVQKSPMFRELAIGWLAMAGLFTLGVLMVQGVVSLIN
jgi:hypothetical protein